MKINVSNLATLVVTSLSVSACGGTSRYVDQPQFSMTDSQKSMSQAVDALFRAGASPYTIKLCDADQSSKTCTKANEGLSAFGIGGVSSRSA